MVSHRGELRGLGRATPGGSRCGGTLRPGGAAGRGRPARTGRVGGRCGPLRDLVRDLVRAPFGGSGEPWRLVRVHGRLRDGGPRSLLVRDLLGLGGLGRLGGLLLIQGRRADVGLSHRRKDGGDEHQPDHHPVEAPAPPAPRAQGEQDRRQQQHQCPGRPVLLRRQDAQVLQLPAEPGHRVGGEAGGGQRDLAAVETAVIGAEDRQHRRAGAGGRLAHRQGQAGRQPVAVNPDCAAALQAAILGFEIGSHPGRQLAAGAPLWHHGLLQVAAKGAPVEREGVGAKGAADAAERGGFHAAGLDRARAGQEAERVAAGRKVARIQVQRLPGAVVGAALGLAAGVAYLNRVDRLRVTRPPEGHVHLARRRVGRAAQGQVVMARRCAHRAQAGGRLRFLVHAALETVAAAGARQVPGLGNGLLGAVERRSGECEREAQQTEQPQPGQE